MSSVLFLPFYSGCSELTVPGDANDDIVLSFPSSHSFDYIIMEK